MKAWNFTGTHEPLTTVESEDPIPGENEVRIRVKAAGLCHSDVGILEDEKWLAQIPNLPLVPGHEIAGVIDRVGPGVSRYSVDDRVAVCPMIEFHGYGRNGGFAEYVIAGTDALVPIPESVSYELAAVSTDAGMTSHGAVMETGALKRGERVAIIGFGGLGQVGARIAVLNGGVLFVVEVNEDLWDRAFAAGAQRVVHDVAELADENLDLIVDFAGVGTTTAAGLETLAVGGRLVLVGMHRLEATINTYPLIMRRLQLLGNMGGSKEDIAAVMAWMEKGEIQPSITPIEFEDVADGFARLQRGEAGGRLVVQYHD